MPQQPTAKLDLAGVGWPVSLLEFKRAIGGMGTGDILEILLRDPETVEELVTIVERSPDHILVINEEGGRYRIRLRKG